MSSWGQQSGRSCVATHFLSSRTSFFFEKTHFCAKPCFGVFARPIHLKATRFGGLPPRLARARVGAWIMGQRREDFLCDVSKEDHRYGGFGLPVNQGRNGKSQRKHTHR